MRVRAFRFLLPSLSSTLFGALGLSLLPPLAAQSVGYTTVSEMEFGGAMGAMMQMVPDMENEIREDTFIKGNLVRTDNDQTGTITDLESGETTFIQHEDKVFYTLDMREMGERFAGAGGPGEAMEEDGSDMDFDFRLNVDRTGKKKRFDGYSAEQVLMTMEMIPRNEEARESVEESGTMVVFTELWLSTDFPGYEALESMRAQFTEGGVSDRGAGGYNASLTQAFSSDPRMREAFEKSREELQDLDGVPIKTVTSMVRVPKGAEFDAEAVLDATGKPLEASGGMADLMGQAAGAAASGAAREALGRMGGMFGRGKKKDKDEGAAPQGGQSIMMRVTSSLENVRTSGIPDSVFSPPQGYEEQTPPWMGGLQ